RGVLFRSCLSCQERRSRRRRRPHRIRRPRRHHLQRRNGQAKTGARNPKKIRLRYPAVLGSTMKREFILCCFSLAYYAAIVWNKRCERWLAVLQTFVKAQQD